MFWQLLNRIRQLWGENYVRYVKASPYLLNLIQQDAYLFMDESLAEVGFCKGKRIDIGIDIKPSEFCAVLAHELIHCKQPEIPKGDKISVFVSRCLKQEIEAKVAEVIVLKDLHDANLPISEHHKDYFCFSSEELKTLFSERIWGWKTSTTGEYYSEYYSRLWQQYSHG